MLTKIKLALAISLSKVDDNSKPVNLQEVDFIFCAAIGLHFNLILFVGTGRADGEFISVGASTSQRSSGSVSSGQEHSRGCGKRYRGC